MKTADKIFVTYKYKLKLTQAQEARVCSWIGACRYVYNLAIETKICAFQKGVNLSKFDITNQLPALKEIDWIKDVPANTLIDVSARVDNTFQKFFKGSGFPKWAKKEYYTSITFRAGIKKGQGGFILPKLGFVKVFKDRMPDGEIKTAIIKKENNSFFICITFNSKTKNIYPTCESQAVGIDMGIKYFLVDSSGCFVENPRHTKKYEAKLRVKNRELARKKKGSKQRNRVKSELSSLHRKIFNSRNDFTHKVSINYIKNNSLIVCEDLIVKNMIKCGSLSKHISDAGWSGFFDKIKYKSILYNKDFIKVDPKHTSQKCSKCGDVNKENRLTQSMFLCVSCGHEQNADHNASINILGLGKAFVRQREAIACA